MAEGVVEHYLDEDSLDRGAIRLTERQANLLGLPGHRTDPLISFGGERFHVQWAAVDRELRGELLAENLQLNATIGSLARLIPRQDGLELSLTSPNEGRQSRLAGFDPAPRRRTSSKSGGVATASPRRSSRKSRQDRYRLRERGEYEWHDGIGIHTPTLVQFRSHIEEGGWDPPELFELRIAGEELAAVNNFEELMAVDQAKVDHMPHQEATARRVLARMQGRGILADEVGLGKTIEAGLIMKELMLRGLVDRVLVLCPASLREQWREELESKFDEVFTVATSGGRDLSADRLITSLALGRRNIPQLTERPWDLVIWDEAHKGAGPSATSTRNLWQSIESRYLLFLTATPVQNDLLELYRLVEMLRPGTFRSQREFKSRFLDNGNAREPRNPRDLRKLVSDVMVRTTREQAGLDRVKRHPKDVAVRLGRTERDLYRLCTDGLRTVLNGPHDHFRRRHLAHRLTSSPRSLALTAGKIAKDHSVTPEAQRFLRELADFSIDSGLTSRQMHLLSILGEWTHDQDKGQAIVFTQHNDTLHDLARILDAQGVEALAFHGQLSAGKRQQVLKGFKDGAPVLLSTDAGAEGLNMQFANCVVNYDLPWNPMKIEQRIGRVHRVTQKRDVHVANLYAKGTVDEHVYRILHDKLRMFELLFGQVTTILGELHDDRDRSFENLVFDALLSRDDGEMEARLKRLGQQVDDAWSTTQAMIGDEGGLNSWMADRSYREKLTTNATELSPDIIASRTRKRQSSVREFVRDYLQVLGVEVTFEQAADDEGRGAFLSGRVPEDLIDDLDGRTELHLAFDGGALEMHQDAELCAAGTEIFELLVLSLSARGDLLAEMPPRPELPSEALVPHVDDLYFVGRRVLGPESWDGEAVWRVRTETGDGGDQILRIPIGNPQRLLSVAHRHLDAAEPLPESFGDFEAVRQRVIDGSEKALRKVQAEAQSSLDGLAQREKARMLEHYSERQDELRDQLSRAYESGRVAALEKELSQIARAREQQQQQRVASAEIRADLLAIRLVGSTRARVEEKWARGDTEYAVTGTWHRSRLQLTDPDGEAISTLDLCRDGHPNDVERLSACSGCGLSSCASCTGAAQLHDCGWCGSAVCEACSSDTLCPACATPTRDDHIDRDGLVGWRLGANSTVLVGTGMAVVERAGVTSTLVDRLDSDEDRSRVAFAATLGRRLDLGVRRLPHPDPVTDAVGIPLGQTRAFAWSFDPEGDKGDGVLPLLSGLEDEVHPAHRMGDHPLAGLIRILRRSVRPSAPGCVVVDPVVTSLTLAADAGRPVIVANSHTGGGASWTSNVPARVKIEGPGFRARAEVNGRTIYVERVNDSYEVTVTDEDGDGDSWFVPGGDGVTEASERGVVGATDLRTGPNTILGVDDLGPEPTPLAAPAGLSVERTVTEKRSLRPTARRSMTVEDLTTLGIPMGDEYAIAVADTEREALHRALVTIDVNRPVPNGIRRSWALNETWQKGSIRVERPPRDLGPGEPAWPVLDDTGEPGELLDICDRAHLHVADRDWTCASCDETLCEACGPDGALGDCPTCDRATCGRCRRELHDVAPVRCEWCDDTSCPDCGTVVSFDTCVACGQVMCAACLGDEHCQLCSSLVAAPEELVSVLPAHLCAHGLDVRLSTGPRRTLLTLVGHERRELAVLDAESNVVDWTTLVVEDPTSLLLRIAAAHRTPSTADISLHPDVLGDRAGEREGRVLLDRSVTTVTWEIVSQGLVLADGNLERRTGEDDDDAGSERMELATHLGREEVPRPLEVGRAAVVDQVVPDARSEPDAVLQVRRVMHVDQVVLEAEGLVAVRGEAGHEQRDVAPWADVSTQWQPQPTFAAASAIGECGATLMAWGPVVMLAVDSPGGASVYRVDSDPLPIEAVHLASALKVDGAAVPSDWVDPSDTTMLSVRDAARSGVETSWIAVESSAPARPELIEELMSVIGPVESSLPRPATSRITLRRQLRQGLVDTVPADRRSPTVVSVQLSAVEHWTVGEQTVSIPVVLSAAEPEAHVIARDTGARLTKMFVDDEGHCVEALAVCRRCSARRCVACADPVVYCDLCDSPLCGHCRGAHQTRCAACVNLRPLGRVRRSLSYPQFTHVVTGVGSGLRVTFGLTPGGEVRRAVAPPDAKNPEFVPVVLSPERTAALDLRAGHGVFGGAAGGQP